MVAQVEPAKLLDECVAVLWKRWERAMYCRCRDLESVGVGRVEGGAVVTGVGMEPRESGGDVVNSLRMGVWAGG